MRAGSCACLGAVPMAPCRWRQPRISDQGPARIAARPRRVLVDPSDAVMRVPSMLLAATGKIDKIALRAAFSGS